MSALSKSPRNVGIVRPAAIPQHTEQGPSRPHPTRSSMAKEKMPQGPSSSPNLIVPQAQSSPLGDPKALGSVNSFAQNYSSPRLERNSRKFPVLRSLRAPPRPQFARLYPLLPPCLPFHPVSRTDPSRVPALLSASDLPPSQPSSPAAPLTGTWAGLSRLAMVCRLRSTAGPGRSTGCQDQPGLVAQASSC